MTRAQALREARQSLSGGGVDDAAFEAEYLLRYALSLTRSELLASTESDINLDSLARYRDFVARRKAGEPSAYITGGREFYGLDFMVDRRVLIPRPESELLVEEAIRLAANGLHVLADIGTGSGAIAVSLAVNLPGARVYATDVSPEALAVAAGNARHHDVESRVTLLCGDLLEPLPEPIDAIVANLPYVHRGQLSTVNTGGYEPLIALDGGGDGLDHIRRLARQAPGKLNTGGSLLLEVGRGQDADVTSFLRQCFPQAAIRALTDLGGICRLVVLTLS